MDTEYDDFGGISQRAGDKSALLIQVDNGKAIVAVSICSAFCALATAIAVWAAWQADRMTTEYRIELNHRMEMQAEQAEMQRELQELRHEQR